MNYTQNDKIMSINVGAIVVGVDIAKAVHYARAFDYRGIELAKVFHFENTREGLGAFKKWWMPWQKRKVKAAVLLEWSLQPTIGLI